MELRGNWVIEKKKEEKEIVVIDKQFMPTILIGAMDVLNDLHPNADENSKLNILLSKAAQMVSFQRVYFKEFENTKLINYYAINFMPSGMGKDKICNDLDKFIFNEFITYFKNRAMDYKTKQELDVEKEANSKFQDEKSQSKKDAYIEIEKSKIRYLDIEINNATPEGFFADAKALDKAGFGSVFVKNSEFGLFLKNNRKDDLLYFSTLYEGYDGKVSSKSTKHEQRECSIENMPVNALLHADVSLFKADIKQAFDSLMETGLARRAIISFQSNNKKSIEANPVLARKRINQAYSKAKVISSEMYKLFLKIPKGAIYELTEDAHDNVLYPYLIKITELYNSCNDKGLLCKEIASRELKVLKLSGMFACLNHPTDLYIYESDIEQAINVVEQLSQDFKRFIDYKVETKDNYELLLNFLMENIGEEFTKTELVNERYKDFGFKREAFRTDFDKTIEIISEMASEKGYYLQERLINNNSGQAVSLVKNNIGTSLPEGVKELDDLV